MIARLRPLMEPRFRISTLLYAGIGGAVVLTILASLVGWFSFERVGDAQTRVNEGSVPELAASFGVAQSGTALVAAAPRLTAAPTQEEFTVVSNEIDASYRAFEDQLNILEENSDQPFEDIRGSADMLLFNIDAIEDGMSEFYELSRQRRYLGAELAVIRSRLDGTLARAIDDQLFYVMTGYRDIGVSPAPRSEYLSENEFRRYRNLAELQAAGNAATELLANAFTVSDPAAIEPFRERFEAAIGKVERKLAALEETELPGDAALIFARLFELGAGEQSGFDLLERQLRLAQTQQELLAQNRDISIELLTGVDVVVSRSQSSAAEATLASSQAILTGQTLLLVISGVSIVGAGLISWLFVGRLLLRRLERLSDWMRRMAGGDLEAQVEIGGRDEVADMAAALEVFRRHALEVQRLNLVEKLAEDLQDKNDELESVLIQLRRAQDQVIMREKLAALGELTAGVAHEIRNPLNFVNNFSEVSVEMVTELLEVIDEDGTTLSDDQRSLIQDISDDLSGNLQRIRQHGERANRIVHDMLMLGRGAGDRQLTNINNLLSEHANLAYHSARATDPDFQLQIREEFDPDMGEVEVIPQEIARVFLNMVANACQATDEKRRNAVGSGENAEPYIPSLLLSTRRGEDSAEMSIRDNGDGIPPDIADRIFNPFFTTKPPDQGTGLGLSICNDIVRGHGGNIRVQSEPGQYTEMSIELPLTPPVPVAAGPPALPA